MLFGWSVVLGRGVGARVGGGVGLLWVAVWVVVRAGGWLLCCFV